VALWVDKLFVEPAEVEDGWLWHSAMTGNMLEVGFGYFGKLGLGNAGAGGASMRNIASVVKPIAWYG
jgi:hypothetical protein